MKSHLGISGINKMDIYNDCLRDPIMEYHLPYDVFISRVLRYHEVDVSNEVTIGCTKKNMIEKLFLDHMWLKRNENGWFFKDEQRPKTEEAQSINIDVSKYHFRPQTDFEKFVVDQFKSRDDKMSKLQKSFSELHRKMDYALRINAFSGTSKDDSGNEQDKTDKNLIETSDSE
ncbi:hypothetical protein LR48_Vigan277s000500 [Vigna angularis]|uniref:Uncharacterized protein n=1 Tax=Phaseolus angularis TaxID=3914 RepID=A0A0L9T7B6_PHAAN|nr:hypothetical protein LR48_Vigan277s000500 [Vigna angularis]